MSVAKYVSKAAALFKGNPVFTTNLVAGLAVIALEQIFSIAAFICPCKQTPEEGGNATYGMCFFLVPAVVLFCLSFIANPETRKNITGYCNTGEKCCSVECCSSTMEKFSLGCGCSAIKLLSSALIAPAVWICTSLLEGKYYACAMTTKPYNKTCEEIYASDKVEFTLEYHDRVSESHVIGWGVSAGAAAVAMIVYILVKCYSKETNWERECRDIEVTINKKVFKDHAKLKVEEEIKKNAVTSKDAFDKLRAVHDRPEQDKQSDEDKAKPQEEQQPNKEEDVAVTTV